LILNIYNTIYNIIIYDKILSKEEVLKITNRYYISYHCRNDICILTDNDYCTHIVEFPDENGNLIEYITDTCNYSDIQLNKCNDVTSCNNDKECLSNKCYKNICMFNNETQIIHCDNIYTKPTLFRDRSSYMYCGKAYRDICNENDECSSKKCIYNRCRMQTNGPNEGEGIGVYVSFMIYATIILIICLIILIIYKICKKK